MTDRLPQKEMERIKDRVGEDRVTKKDINQYLQENPKLMKNLVFSKSPLLKSEYCLNYIFSYNVMSPYLDKIQNLHN